MPTIGSIVDRLRVDEDTAEGLKAWLTAAHISYDLKEEADMGFCLLSDADLQEAGVHRPQERAHVLQILKALKREHAASSVPRNLPSHDLDEP